MQLPGASPIVAVVIPCLDEEAAIAGVVREVLEQGADEVIVADNGSLGDAFQTTSNGGC